MADVNPVAPVAASRDAVAKHAATQGLTLEIAAQDERAKLLDIAKRAYPDDGQWYKNPGDVAHYVQRDRSFSQRGLKCIVAKDNGTIIGYIFYQPSRRKGSELYIKEIGVDPGRQGKGIGTILLAYAVGEAADTGRSAIKLYVTTHEGYYTNLGFTVVPQNQHAAEGYTTDDENPVEDSTLLSGAVVAVAQTLGNLLKLKG